MRDHTKSSVFHIHSLFVHLAKSWPSRTSAQPRHKTGGGPRYVLYYRHRYGWTTISNTVTYMSSVTLASVCYWTHIMNSSFQDCNSLCFTNFVPPATFWSSSISTESSWNSSYGMVFAHGVRSTESTKGNVILNLNFLRWLNHTNQIKCRPACC